MLKNSMEDKRLDFNAPLMSVRRFASAPALAPSSALATSSAVEDGNRTFGERPPPKRSLLPFYKSELKSGPVRNPGAIPFVWEQTPGQPKDKDDSGLHSGNTGGKPLNRPLVAPKLPPGRISKRNDERESDSTSAINHSSNGPISSSKENVVNFVDIPKRDAKVKPKLLEEVILERHSDSDDEEEDAFSDALDSLSRTESSYMNCSISGLTGGAELGEAEPSGSFSTDPQVRDFMMGRFLPAAKAVASAASPQWTSKKPPPLARDIAGQTENGERRRPLPLPYQHRPHYADEYREEGRDDDNDSDDDYDETGHLAMKGGCGLLTRFCLKGSFCILNPVPGVKVRSRPPLPSVRKLTPQNKSTPQGSLGDARERDTWEAVYKHKLGRDSQRHVEYGSKLTSESNQLTYWSDSQTPDGSSPYRHSPVGGVSPYRNDATKSPFHEGKGFLGVGSNETKSCSPESYIKEGDQYWEITPDLSSKQGSGSVSPAAEKSLYVDALTMPETPDSKTRSAESKGMIIDLKRDSDVAAESWRNRTFVLDSSEEKEPQLNGFVPVDSDKPSSMDGSNPGKQMDSTEVSRYDDAVASPELLAAEDRGKNDPNAVQPILPPPLPNTPSESWLWRTLPNVSSKNPTRQSFLGIQFHPRKQAVRQPCTDPKWETIVKTSHADNCQMRFSEILAKSISEE